MFLENTAFAYLHGFLLNLDWKIKEKDIYIFM